jgi:hypothetical protein
MKLDDREVATVLAGLRLLQNPRTFVPSQIEEIASKGGWCWSIYPPDPSYHVWWEYEDPAFYDTEDFKIEIIEVADENAFVEMGEFEVTTATNLASGAFKAHIIDRAGIIAGLVVMARNFPELFGKVLDGDKDAPCADIFLQCVCFGEEKYA